MATTSSSSNKRAEALRALRAHLRETAPESAFLLHIHDPKEREQFLRADWKTRLGDFIASRREGERIAVFLVESDSCARYVHAYVCGLYSELTPFHFREGIKFSNVQRSLVEALRKY